MLGAILMVTFVAAVDPVRLAVTLLMISRPRPMSGLLAYWVGCVLASVPSVLVPVLMLHYVPMFRPFTQSLASTIMGALASTTGRQVQLGMGALALVVAVLMAVHYAARQQAPVSLTVSPAGMVTQPRHPVFYLFGRAADPSRRNESAIWLLLRRAHAAWENGSSRMAFVIGVLSGPPPLELLVFVTAVVASGAALGMQVIAALGFVIGMLAVIEFILLGHLVAPAKTEAMVQRLHEAVRANQRWVFVALSAAMGSWMVVGNI
ncbi:GAP family protein [Mycobacterium sp.]|uniref:GAP family protein n=1 Tax=Mycobacterium sp. TaxID=1785 RepID=UPI0025FC0B07|nr:GAP family protein [Mycobacterium sp.]MBW0014814.1 GAP family protein [Mycobacterium sp.]